MRRETGFSGSPHLDSAEPAYPSEFRMPSGIVSVTLKRGMRGVCIDANDRKINTL